MVCSRPMKITSEVKDKLDKLKIHERQSYSEVINNLILFYCNYYEEVEIKDGLGIAKYG